jgi:hypothetical protein
VDQAKIREKLEASGGRYFVATDFTGFKGWFDEVING